MEAEALEAEAVEAEAEAVQLEAEAEAETVNSWSLPTPWSKYLKIFIFFSIFKNF